VTKRELLLLLQAESHRCRDPHRQSLKGRLSVFRIPARSRISGGSHALTRAEFRLLRLTAVTLTLACR
jgi:hypothetical protein